MDDNTINARVAELTRLSAEDEKELQRLQGILVEVQNAIAQRRDALISRRGGVIELRNMLPKPPAISPEELAKALETAPKDGGKDK